MPKRTEQQKSSHGHREYREHTQKRKSLKSSVATISYMEVLSSSAGFVSQTGSTGVIWSQTKKKMEALTPVQCLEYKCIHFICPL